jgi:hypothetical protein
MDSPTLVAVIEHELGRRGLMLPNGFEGRLAGSVDAIAVVCPEALVAFRSPDPDIGHLRTLREQISPARFILGERGEPR